MIKVSVIVPVYNVESYLAKCLDSLVNQTLKELEIIVIDDESPDNSSKIIADYVKKYPQKIKSFRKENGGQGSARNMGLKYAQGEYIAFVDSDDFVNLDMFLKMYDIAKKDGSDIVICGNNNISLDGKIVGVEKAKLFTDTTLSILFGKMAVWNKIYRKEILKGIDFRSNCWYEDFDYSAKILLNNYQISFTDDALYNYLIRPGSTMNNSNIAKNLDILLAFDEILKYFKDKMNDDIYAKLEFLAIYHIYIASTSRVILAQDNKKNKIAIINKFRDYMYNNFPNYQDNFYLQYMSLNKKIIYKLINLKWYNIIRIVLMIKKKLK